MVSRSVSTLADKPQVVTSKSDVDQVSIPYYEKPGAFVNVASSSAVMDDLKLDAPQRDHMRKLRDQLKRGEPCRQKSNPKCAEAIPAFLKLCTQLDSEAKSILTPEHLERCRQIRWQSAGLFGLPQQLDLIEKLKLSADTRQQLHEVVKGFDKEVQSMTKDLQARNDQDEAIVEEQMIKLALETRRLRGQAMKNIRNALTSMEWDLYQSLLGPKFSEEN